MKRYVGERTPQGCKVTVIDETGERPLDPRHDLRTHSPTGFEYGYPGSGPAQLALALLADALDDDERAQGLYQDFKSAVIARLEGDRWEMTEADVRRAVARIEAGRGGRPEGAGTPAEPAGERAMPGTPIDLPLPPALCETFGYGGNARYVAFAWWPGADTVSFDDGLGSGTGHGWSWLSYRRHRAVAPLLAPFELGASDAEAEHALVIDRERNRASVATTDEAEEFVRTQHPPRTPPSPAGDVAEGWREERVDQAEVMRRMADQRARVGRMISWLDMAPVPPPQEGRGA